MTEILADEEEGKTGERVNGACPMTEECREHFIASRKLNEKLDKTLGIIAEMREDTKNLEALTFIAKAIENVTRRDIKAYANPDGNKKRFSLVSGASLYAFALILLSVVLLVKELHGGPAKLEAGPTGFKFSTEGQSQSQPGGQLHEQPAKP